MMRIDVGVNHRLTVGPLRNESTILDHLQVGGAGSPFTGEVVPRKIELTTSRASGCMVRMCCSRPGSGAHLGVGVSKAHHG